VYPCARAGGWQRAVRVLLCAPRCSGLQSVACRVAAAAGRTRGVAPSLGACGSGGQGQRREGRGGPVGPWRTAPGSAEGSSGGTHKDGDSEGPQPRTEDRTTLLDISLPVPFYWTTTRGACALCASLSLLPARGTRCALLSRALPAACPLDRGTGGGTAEGGSGNQAGGTHA
jgi:hypothetical protein